MVIEVQHAALADLAVMRPLRPTRTPAAAAARPAAQKRPADRRARHRQLGCAGGLLHIRRRAPNAAPDTVGAVDGVGDVRAAVQRLAGGQSAEDLCWDRQRGGGAARNLAVSETIILLHPPLPSVGASIWMKRGCQ